METWFQHSAQVKSTKKKQFKVILEALVRKQSLFVNSPFVLWGIDFLKNQGSDLDSGTFTLLLAFEGNAHHQGRVRIQAKDKLNTNTVTCLYMEM